MPTYISDEEPQFGYKESMTAFFDLTFDSRTTIRKTAQTVAQFQGDTGSTRNVNSPLNLNKAHQTITQANPGADNTIINLSLDTMNFKTFSVQNDDNRQFAVKFETIFPENNFSDQYRDLKLLYQAGIGGALLKFLLILRV